MSKLPRKGSKAWRAARLDDPNHARNCVLNLVQDAEQGNHDAAVRLYEWLKRHPALRCEVLHLSDLGTRCDRSWAAGLAGRSELRRDAHLEEAATLRVELLGSNPSLIDRMLVNTVLAAYLDHARASLAASVPTDLPAVRAEKAKQLSLAQKRLLDAVEAWEARAGKTPRGLKPTGNVKSSKPARSRPAARRATRLTGDAV